MAVNRFYLASDMERRILKTVDAWVRGGLMVHSWPETKRISSDVSALASDLTGHVEEIFVNMERGGT